MEVDGLVFVGFNRRAAALDKNSGEIIWRWKAPSGMGFVSLLLDGEDLFVAVQGHTYCLDPRTGQELWHNSMSGFGYGVTSIATTRGHTPHALLGQAAADEASRRRASKSHG